MLAGTGSDVGKSILAAAFCRILKHTHPWYYRKMEEKQ